MKSFFFPQFCFEKIVMLAFKTVLTPAETWIMQYDYQLIQTQTIFTSDRKEVNTLPPRPHPHHSKNTTTTIQSAPKPQSIPPPLVYTHAFTLTAPLPYQFKMNM